MSATGVVIAVAGAVAICANAGWIGERPDLLMLAGVSVAFAAPFAAVALLWCDETPRVTIVYELLPPLSR